MAITRAQQYRQMLKDGNFVMQGGVKNYLGKQKTVSNVPLKWQSGSDKPATELAYITKAEKDLLLKKDIHGSLKNGPNTGPEGIMSLDSQGDKGTYGDTGQSYGDRQTSDNSPEVGDKGGGYQEKGDPGYQETINRIREAAKAEEARQQARQDAEKKRQEEESKQRAKDFTKAKKEDKDRKQKRLNAILNAKNKFGINTLGLTQMELADLKAAGLYDEEEGFKDSEDFGLLDSNPTSGLYNLLEKDDRFSGANQYNFENSYDSGGLKGPVLSLLDPFFKKGAKKTKEFFTDDVLGAGRFKYLGKTVTPEMFSMMSPSQMDEVYGGYMSGRQSGETDAYGNVNPDFGKGGGDNNYVPPIIPEDDTTEEDEVNPRDYTGLAPRFMGSSFDFTGLADGGRAGYQQGGSIMPRLNDLSGDVSSAEQMLQEINQRLESAESTLGEGGAMQQPAFQQPMSPLENAMRGIGQPLNNSRTSGLENAMRGFGSNNGGFSNNFQPQLSIANYKPFAGETFSQDQIPEQYKAGFDEYIKENPIGIGGQAFSYSMLPDGNRVMFSNTAGAGVFGDYLKSIGAMPDNPFEPRQMAPNMTGQVNSLPGGALSPLASSMRQGAMDGGRMRQMEMMEDEDDPTGGIMDLESGRQMYFLGKLVKKAGRAIKKVAKSPIGKAALLYFGGNALMGAGGGKGLGSFFGKGSFNPLKALITKGPQTGMLGSSGLGKIFGNLGLAKEGALTLGGKLGLGIGVPMALDALGVGKEEDGFDIDEYYKTQGIDIDAIRNNPNRILARRFMAEGGDAEPVAKKTMPLLDMDGQEMDLRAEGGFVPIGRMERADDVPARLSKNEFVFTADAVRNAGEGDIDKGAEVMYNMMKNLESGGEVSEESQGLDGAREMFKTSQRLEEVL